MAGRVDQVEDVVLAVAGRVVQPHRLRLDGDAALALDVHGIEHLRRHLARIQRRRTSRSGGRPASTCRGRYARRSRNCGSGKGRSYGNGYPWPKFGSSCECSQRVSGSVHDPYHPGAAIRGLVEKHVRCDREGSYPHADLEARPADQGVTGNTAQACLMRSRARSACTEPEQGYWRSTAPVALAAAVTIRSATTSISASVRVRSRRLQPHGDCQGLVLRRDARSDIDVEQRGSRGSAGGRPRARRRRRRRRGPCPRR